MLFSGGYTATTLDTLPEAVHTCEHLWRKDYDRHVEQGATEQNGRILSSWCMPYNLYIYIYILFAFRPFESETSVLLSYI